MTVPHTQQSTRLSDNSNTSAAIRAVTEGIPQSVSLNYAVFQISQGPPQCFYASAELLPSNALSQSYSTGCPHRTLQSVALHRPLLTQLLSMTHKKNTGTLCDVTMKRVRATIVAVEKAIGIT